MTKSSLVYRDPREYIDFMLKKFIVDRCFYLGATLVSLGLLIVGFYLLVKDPKSIKTALALLGPTGLITLCCYRILKFWNDCYKIISDFLKRPK